MAAGQILEGRATLTGLAARQIARVLRLRPGEEILLFDEEGRKHAARLLRVTASRVEAAMVPLLFARCVATGPGRLTCWRTIAREAAEQSGRTHLPAIAPPVPLSTFLAGLRAKVVRLALLQFLAGDLG